MRMSLFGMTPYAALVPAMAGPVPAALRRASRWVARRVAGRGDAAHLPVRGLPGRTGDLPSGAPALLLWTSEHGRDQLLQALFDDATAGHHVTWICAPERSQQCLTPGLREAASRGLLRTLSWSPDAAQQMRIHGPAQLVRELLHIGHAAGDLLVVDALEPWLTEVAEDTALEAGLSEAVQALLRWCAERTGPVLALAPARHRGQELLPLLGHARIARIAVLEHLGASARLDVLRWGTAAAGARFLVDTPAQGAWTHRATERLDEDTRAAPADRAVVHTTRAAVRDATATPAGWLVHPNLETLLAATRDAVAATVVLAHDQPEALAALADCIHGLRRAHPHLLKIVVREVGVPLRRNASLALLRLGANVVIERDQGFGQLHRAVEALADETYASTATALTPQQALERLAPDRVHGYLAPRDFCTLVERMLERSAGTPMEHSLVVLPLLPHVAHVDALLACNARRDGDVVTADARGLVLFLYGCPSQNAPAALESLFSLPCSELAQHIQIDPDALSQHDALLALRRTTDDAPVDYSAFLRGSRAVRRATPAQPAVLPVRSPDAARSVQTHVLALRSPA